MGLEMVHAKSDDGEEAPDALAPEPDIAVVPDGVPDDELEIGSGLTIRFDQPYSDDTYEELDVLRRTPPRPTIRQNVAEAFGPEMTAGVVIGLLIATFFLLMVAGVRNEPASVIEEPVAPAVAPPAADPSDQQPSIDIGEAVTLERE